MSDKKPERKKYSSRAAAAASDNVGSVNLEEASSTSMQQDSMKTETSSPPPDYQTFTENVTYTLNRVMETLSIVNDRLESLEQRKASPAPSESENSGRIKENEVQAPEDSEGSKPSSTGLAERIFERRIKSSEGRRRRYSTLEDLVSRREYTRRRLHFNEDSEDEVLSVGSRSQAQADQSLNTKSKKPGKIFRELKSSEEATETRPVMVMRKEKECHITIEKFQLSKVAKAIRDILDFQEEEETTVRIQKVLSRNLKEHLRLVYNITHADVAKMDMADLFQIIARETRVYSTVAFYNELRDSLAHVRIMDWSKVSAINHEVFYFQQLKLIDNFKRMLQIMLECNRKWCPRVDDKEYGLIRLFKTLNDPAYVRYAFGCMSTLKFDTMSDFFEEFSAVILDHYQVSLVTRELPYKGNQEHKERLRDYYEKKRQLSQNQKGPQFSSRKPHHISHIRNEIFDSDEDVPDLEDADWRDMDSDAFQDEDHNISGGTESNFTGGEVTKTSAESESKDMEQLHAVMQQGQKSSTVKFGCIKKMLHGKCDKSSCQYSHNEATVMQSALDMRDKLDAYIKTHSGASGGKPQNPAVLRRDHFGDPRA